MGNLIFRRKRRRVTEELDEIVLILKELETQLSQNLKSRSESLRFLYYFLLFLFSVSSAYLWLHYKHLKIRLALIAAIFCAHLILFFLLRYALFAFYEWLIGKKRKKMHFYTERKIAIIEDVKENEKFKIAKDIIEKYGSKEELMDIENKTNNNDQRTNNLSTTTRVLPNIVSCPATPTSINPPISFDMQKVVPKLHEIQDKKFLRTPIRPFVEQSQTPIDKILDYVIGENISNRYALICLQCHTHNGMALKEEFDQISYLCYKCSFYNPSRNEMRETKRIKPLQQGLSQKRSLPNSPEATEQPTPTDSDE